MSKRPQLPGDPSELHLHIAYDDDLRDTPHAETVERFDVAVRHGRDVHDDGRCPGAGDVGTPGQCVDGGCPALAKDGVEVGQMTFFRVHLDRGMNAYWALEEEGEDLYEFAQVLLDKDTGNFADEVDESLPYAGGLALLIMDRVTLARPWRGRGLAAILAAEVIHRLLPGCRAVACSPGISDLGPDQQRTLDRAEWDRVTARIRTGWERVGFRPYRNDVYLVSPADEVLEEQRAALRAELAQLGAAWRKAAAAEDSPG